jgi:excisionase family DNA binding protein
MGTPLTFYTIKEAAKLLQLGERTILDHARRGKIPARKIGHEWRIEGSVLREFMRGQPQPGQPIEVRG